MHLLIWSTEPDYAKILLDIPFPMNHVVIDELGLKLDIFLDNTLQILGYRYHVNCFYALQKLGRLIDYSKIAKMWLV